jgi:carotenoid cleavage dioxygenase-like enzyme
MSTATNPYLSGNFAPVRQEFGGLECPEVTGEIPRDLAGSFLRVGPNPQFEPIDGDTYHPFDGDGMIHQMRFDGGRAVYSNRWVRTQGFERERREGKALWTGFSSLPNMQHPEDMLMKNLANTAMVWHAGRLLALWEAGNPYEVTLPDLETRGEDTFDGKWFGSFTAHPKVDPRSGELIFFGYSPFPPYVRYGVLDAAGNLVHDTHVDLPKAVMIHDMAITENYSLIFDMPLTFDLERAMNGGQAFDWEPSNGARIGVLPRRGEGGEVRWFDIDLGYVFHSFNAFEEGSEIVLDACRTRKTRILEGSDEPMTEQHSRFHRYRLNLDTGRASEEPISPVPLEFSRINESYVGVRNRYAYASRFSDRNDVGTLFTAVLKYDRENDEIQTCELGDGAFTQEFVFAPRPDAAAEDDGWVVGLVHDEKRGASECWIIDAQRFAAGPVARISIPARVPYGFHSHWVGASAIARQTPHVTTSASALA